MKLIKKGTSHFAHRKDWVGEKGTCPLCGAEFMIETLSEVIEAGIKFPGGELGGRKGFFAAKVKCPSCNRITTITRG